MTPIRPKFSNPPLIERAITVVFEKIVAFSLGDYGRFWADIREEFPISEAVPMVLPELETFGDFRPVQPQLHFLAENALPRAYFRNPDSGELIQVQSDRFCFNWIKASPDHAYPHSEAMLERFFSLLGKFEHFLALNKLGVIVTTQCELTNVNVIPVADVGENFADMATVVKLPDLGSPPSFLRLENQMVAAKHLILDDGGNPIGRVHSSGQPSLQVSTNELAYRLDIAARGAPLGPGMNGVKAFFDVAVSAVNSVFLESVTHAGRQFWGEEQRG